jgi:hypothetical protein
MSRPVDPRAQFIVKLHITNGYRYASTQPPSLNPDTGKKKYRYVHWGTVDKNLKFFPSSKYYLASPDERSRLIFPKDWDLSETDKPTGAKNPELHLYTSEEQNRFYGDIWLLEQVAIKTGIRKDLETVFDGNCELVDDILTLAMYPYVTQYTYNRVARWQKIVKSPSQRELTPSVITRITQSITEGHRIRLLKLRAARLETNELCCVDSTSRSEYGDSLADIQWGKNKEGLPLAQTNEVVVYTLSSHLPVYYRTFQGNMPDCSSLEVILKDLEFSGFKNLVFITERGYENISNLEKFIVQQESMIMFTKTSQKIVAKTIAGLGDLDRCTESMDIDTDAKLYYKQYDIDYELETIERQDKTPIRLKVNLYFDPVIRAKELMKLDIDLANQKRSLNEILKTGGMMPDNATIKRNYCYYKVTYDPATRKLLGYTKNDKKISKGRSDSGFYSIITFGVDFDSMKTLHTYRLRDEQEKYFQQMKSQMVSSRQPNWSEEGKTGRLLILFVSLIISSYVRYIWKSTELYDRLSSSLDILDEMKPIRCIEYTNKSQIITPFIGAQVKICEAFNF